MAQRGQHTLHANQRLQNQISARVLCARPPYTATWEDLRARVKMLVLSPWLRRAGGGQAGGQSLHLEAVGLHRQRDGCALGEV